MQSESSSEESAGSWETNQVGRGSKQSGKLQLRSKSGLPGIILMFKIFLGGRQMSLFLS